MTLELDLDFLDKLETDLLEAAGDSLRESKVVRLGDPTTGRVPAVVGEDIDSPGLVFVFTQDAEGTIASIEVARNEGVGRLSDDELRFGAYVRVKRTTEGLEIYGTAGRAASEFNYQAPAPPQRAITLTHFDVMLLRPADEPSMRCLITAFPVTVSGQHYIAPTLESMDFSSLLPENPGMARAVLIEIDRAAIPGVLAGSSAPADAITYSAGDEYAFNRTTGVPGHGRALRDGDYPQQASDGHLLVGWVRLYFNQVQITQDDLLPAQGIFAGEGGGGGLDFGNAATFLGYPLWFNGELVVNS